MTEEKAVEATNNTTEKWLLPLLLWALPLVTLAMGTRRWLPPLASEHGAGIDRMLRYLLISVGALYIIGNVALGYFVWRFSRQSRSHSGQQATKRSGAGRLFRWSL